jgi:hypothetical protein
MIVNFTLIMQMVHFAFAYYLIDRILMRKVVRTIQHDQHEEEQLQTSIDQELKTITILEAQKKESWQKIRQNIHAHAPKEQGICMHQAIEPLLKEESVLEPTRVKKYRDELSQFIVQKVSRVNS